jgi:hypothetical protein
MYPIYPLLCILSSFALVRIENAVATVLSFFVPVEKPLVKRVSPEKKFAMSPVVERKEPNIVRRVRGLFFVAVVAVLGALSACRVCALYNNYSGIILIPVTCMCRLMHTLFC